jgi:hypothetical protein
VIIIVRIKDSQDCQASTHWQCAPHCAGLQDRASLAPFVHIPFMRQLLDPDANAWKLSLNYWRPKEQHQGKEADGYELLS